MVKIVHPVTFRGFDLSGRASLGDLVKNFNYPARFFSARYQKMALVNVPYGTADNSMRPLGLSYLGAYLQANDIPVKGFDFSSEGDNFGELVEKFELADYPVIGLSFYNVNARAGYALAQEIKKRSPSTLIIVGGPHATALGERILEKCLAIDVAVSGEGEVALLELMRALMGGRCPDSVPGVSFKVGSITVKGPESTRIDDLDDLPPPVFQFESDSPTSEMLFYDRELGRLKRAVALVTSRSCPYSCSFCAIILIGRRWRSLSSKSVVRDLSALESAYGKYSHVYFLDANFFVSARRALEVAQHIHSFRSDITFSFSTRVNQLLKGAQYLSALKSLGLRAVELGIESGSQSALNRFAKDTTVEQNDQAVQLLRDNGLDLYLDFVFFDAEASLNDLSLNLEFIERHGLDTYVPWDHLFSHMTPYVGTPIRDHYQKLHSVTFDEDELPDPDSLFIDPRVREVFQQFQLVRPYLAKLRSALEHLEQVGQRSEVHARERARHQMNMVALRRLPYVVLRGLIHQSMNGKELCLRDFLPTFADDTGNRVCSLEDFLDAVLS